MLQFPAMCRWLWRFQQPYLIELKDRVPPLFAWYGDISSWDLFRLSTRRHEHDCPPPASCGIAAQAIQFLSLTLRVLPQE